MPASQGDRVTAILKANAQEIHLLGHGTYQGLKAHPAFGFPNPCILLDSGKTVWGCECWWGAEGLMMDHMRQRFPDAKVVEADIDEARREAEAQA